MSRPYEWGGVYQMGARTFVVYVNKDGLSWCLAVQRPNSAVFMYEWWFPVLIDNIVDPEILSVDASGSEYRPCALIPAGFAGEGMTPMPSQLDARSKVSASFKLCQAIFIFVSILSGNCMTLALL